MIEDYIKGNIDFDFHFFKSNFNYERMPDSMKKQVEFLCAKLDFMYLNNLMQLEVFYPIMVWRNGQRSAAIEDLKTEDIQTIKEILNNTRNNILTARLNDILGVVFKDYNYLLIAAQNYDDYIRTSIDSASSHEIYQAFVRMFYLYKYCKQINKCKNCARFLFDYVYNNHDKEVIIKFYIIKTFNDTFQSIANCIDDAEKTNKIFGEKEIELKIDTLEYIIKYYKKKKDETKIEFYKKEYVDSCVCLANKYPHEYQYIDKAIQVLDKEDDEEKINELRFVREDIIKKFREQLQWTESSISMDKDMNENMNKQIKILREVFENLCPTNRLFYVLKENKPFNKKNVLDSIEGKRKVLVDSCNNIQFKGDDINYSSCNAKEYEVKEYKISKHIELSLQIRDVLLMNLFDEYLIVDETLVNTINEIIDNNLLVPVERQEVVSETIIDTLRTRKYRKGLYILISQLEFGLLYYLKKYKRRFSVNSYDQPKNINNLLKQKNDKVNADREGIVDLIGEDLTFTLEYLLCGEFSGNLRNIYYHEGYQNSSDSSIMEEHAFYFILQAYCMGFE